MQFLSQCGSTSKVQTDRPLRYTVCVAGMFREKVNTRGQEESMAKEYRDTSSLPVFHLGAPPG